MTPQLPKGWRLLKEGETVKKGDKVFYDRLFWESIETGGWLYCLGRHFMTLRKVEDNESL